MKFAIFAGWTQQKPVLINPLTVTYILTSGDHINIHFACGMAECEAYVSVTESLEEVVAKLEEAANGQRATATPDYLSPEALQATIQELMDTVNKLESEKADLAEMYRKAAKYREDAEWERDWVIDQIRQRTDLCPENYRPHVPAGGTCGPHVNNSSTCWREAARKARDE